MGILDKVLGRSKKVEDQPSVQVSCPHTALAPRWDKAEDIGHEDRATSFICDACHQSFTPEEVRTLRRTESERLNTELDLDSAREA